MKLKGASLKTLAECRKKNQEKNREISDITDPEKRICPEKNNLNWYEFWTLEEFYIWFDSFLEQVC